MQGGRCIVLNASYEFLHVTNTWFDSLRLIQKGKAIAIENYPTAVRAEKVQFFVPAIAVLRNYVNTPKKRCHFAAPTKRNVLIRDKFMCAYCSKKLSISSVTKDHVLPVSRGGSDTLNNVVASCTECNARKADRTPEEARMPLRVYPRALNEEEKMELLVKTHKSSERNVWREALDRLNVKLF